MGLFEFLAPEIAEASHLREISDSLRAQSSVSRHQASSTVQTNRELGNIQQRLSDLERENGILGLLVVSLLKQLSEHTEITMKQVFDQLKEIDLLDGIQDGKISLSSLRLMFGLDIAEPKAPKEQQSEFWVCDECNHRNASKYSSCLYCGKKNS